MASNVSDIRDVDELEVYGNEKQSSVVKITSYVFEVSEFYKIINNTRVFFKFSTS